ncbi:hypothetical protein ANN_15885, partial [Periplaneta americana]
DKMARKHNKKYGSRSYSDFSKENLEKAIDAVKKKELSLRKAAEKYGVPKSTISRKGVPPEGIINYDETNMCDEPGKKKVIVRRNCKHPERLMDGMKSSTSVMFAGTASGHCLPPYVVYRSEQLYHTWIEGGPPGTRLNCSKSGWFEGQIFEDWFFTTVLPYCRRLGNHPKVIIGDNLASHISTNVIETCEKNNITFVLLPPNATHLCPPLDVAFFRPLKVKWRKVLEEWKGKNCGLIPKDTFPRLLKRCLALLESNIAPNLISGFKASSISCGCTTSIETNSNHKC